LRLSGISLLLLRHTAWLGLFSLSLAWGAFSGAQNPTTVPAERSSQGIFPRTSSRGTNRQKQTVPPAPEESRSVSRQPAAVSTPNTSTDILRAWRGLKIRKIEFHGVDAEALSPLPSQLPLQVGEELDPEKVRATLRRLYATGLYQNIQVEGIRSGNDLMLLLTGQPQTFVGAVRVTGVKTDLLAAQLVQATRLNPGTRFSQDRLEEADHNIQQTLEEHGFYQAKFSRTEQQDKHQQVNVTYSIVPGERTRIGNVAVEGDSGLSLSAFRRRARLRQGRKVEHDTTSRALAGLRRHYQKNERLEANVNLQSTTYQAPKNNLDYDFLANQGPVVRVEVYGTKLSTSKIKKMVPVYEEGAVDEDLLNEGDRNLRDYFQRLGYFDVKVSHQEERSAENEVRILFNVDLGNVHRVDSVRITGNQYFDTDTLEDHLSVKRADVLDRHGTFSQSLVNTDANSIKALYQSNGFTNVTVDPVIKDTDEQMRGKKGIAHLQVQYVVKEGVQQKIGRLDISGATQVPLAKLQPLMNAQVGQPYSPVTVAGDRDAILSYYLSQGFTKAQVEVKQVENPDNPSMVDVTMDITEGDQSFVRNVLISGAHFTRPSVIQRELTIHPGDPLNESALLDTQRGLYDLALFNEVNTSIQNPDGDLQRKNVLLQLTEGRRWDLSYGLGFEAQTGNPQSNCNSANFAATLISLGINPADYNCSPNGRFGASPRVIFDITRSNLGGRDQSLTLRSTYGLLEQRVNLIYQAPRAFGGRNFGLTVSGGYNNSQDVTTYAASRLDASIRITQHFNNPGSLLSRANTFIYEFAYRRVKVNPDSIQVSINQIPLLSQPVRVGGPGFNWLRDTRDSPLDAHRGTYNSFQEFLSSSKFGSQANFNRIDITNSSYHSIGKQQWVIARSTRFGYERAFGEDSQRLIPLPERLYAGGSSSHRGFSINAAGPRDPQTGFPIGGAGAFVNTTEFRLPPPTLPFVGTSLSFTLFEDMGNVFRNSSDIWPSMFRVQQPHRETCKDLSNTVQGQNTSTGLTGPCSFNYFSHAVGIGLRYHTPVGPVRADFSYNLNPPIYPVIYDLTNANILPHVGQADHFNFFFSLGQSF
jgi:outer membrane protein insertion porin family